MFCPNHYRGKLFGGKGLVYADHQWASTRKVYDELSKGNEPRIPISAPPSLPLHKRGPALERGAECNGALLRDARA
jgi:hypothetical protein